MITDELVDQALKIVAEGAGNYQYFFANLNSPDWIAPLQRKGRFSNPPQAETRGDSIRFPPWPEGEYLLRMASISPEAVSDAIDEKVYKSDNPLVHELLLRIATELPTTLAARIAEAEAKWASQQPAFYGLYSHRAEPLIAKLAREGRSDSALRLLDPILEVHAPEETRAKREIIVEDRPVRLSADPVGRIAGRDIQHLLAAVGKALAEADPAGILTLLSQRLHQAIQIHENERGNDDDYSTIWRPQIAAGHLGRVLDVLVTAVRDVALAISQGTEGGYETVAAVFEKQRWPIFLRLKYYVLSETEVLPGEFVSSLLAKDTLYQSTTANPEFNQFLSKWAPKVPEKTRVAVLAIIDAGPDLSSYSRYLDRQEKEGKRPEAERWITERWRLGWLTALQSILGERRQAELSTLTEKYGTPRPAFWTSGFHFTADRSEMSLDEMRKLSVPALVTYLKNWEPNPVWEPDTPNRAGLGQTLQQWATDDPALFSENLKSFEDADLHPTYLRSLIDSFTATLKTDRTFDIYAVTRTIEWLLRNTTGSPSHNHDWDEDPGWGWGHMSCARFLAELFLHPRRLDTSRYRELWPALELIAENPSPSPGDEKEYVKGSDFGLLALNSTRSVGLEAVIQYARWIKASESGIRADSEGLPEVFALLARHLNGTADQSIAVREMYGMQFRVLAWLDRAWLEGQLPALFPEEPGVLDRFAWNSYLRFSRPIAGLLPAMRFRYERAVNALQAHANVVEDGERALGGHLIGYYASGAIALDDPLLASFFLKASPRLRAQTIGDIGWHLREEEGGSLPPDVQGRLMALWTSRLASAPRRYGSQERQELASFGWWLASKKFPDDWAIKQAVLVLDTYRKLDPDFAVVERLAELAPAYPFEAAHCLGIVFEEDHDGWAIHGWGENPQIIIREALKGDERSREEATRVLNIFISRGHNGLRSLLQAPTGGDAARGI